MLEPEECRGLFQCHGDAADGDVQRLLKGEVMMAREGDDLGARWIWTNGQDLCHCQWVDLEVGERCVTDIMTESRRQRETEKGDTNLAFIVKTVGDGGGCKTG